jgi:hypothetical protein
MQSVSYSARSEFHCAKSALSSADPICAFNRICTNAIHSNIFEEFDSIAALIPHDDLEIVEIVDFRATHLKELKTPGELNQLALDSDDTSANA